MALTTYAELKTAIAGWLDVSASDLSSQIDDLITVGEKRIFREARTIEMERALDVVMTDGYVTLPNGYVAMKLIYLNTSPIVTLERRSAEWIYQNYPLQSSSGIPKYFGRDVNRFAFGPYPDSSYTVKGTYYVRLPALSSSVNAMYTANPDLYLMACLAEADILLGRDNRIPLWEAKYKRILDDVNAEARNEDQSGSSLQMRVGTNVSASGPRYP